MKFTATLLLLWQCALLSAFSVVPQTATTQLSRQSRESARSLQLPQQLTRATALFMAGGDEGDEQEDEINRTSFSDAGNALIDEEDDERMEAMGDFDTNPAVGTCTVYSSDKSGTVFWTWKQTSLCYSSLRALPGDLLGPYRKMLARNGKT